MENPEKLATQGTQDEDRQNKNTTQYELDTTMFKQIHNVNKTQASPQTPGDKDEPNIVYMLKSLRTSQYRTQNVKTHNTITQKSR